MFRKVHIYIRPLLSPLRADNLLFSGFCGNIANSFSDLHIYSLCVN